MHLAGEVVEDRRPNRLSVHVEVDRRILSCCLTATRVGVGCLQASDGRGVDTRLNAEGDVVDRAVNEVSMAHNPVRVHLHHVRHVLVRVRKWAFLRRAVEADGVLDTRRHIRHRVQNPLDARNDAVLQHVDEVGTPTGGQIDECLDRILDRGHDGVVYPTTDLTATRGDGRADPVNHVRDGVLYIRGQGLEDDNHRTDELLHQLLAHSAQVREQAEDSVDHIRYNRVNIEDISEVLEPLDDPIDEVGDKRHRLLRERGQDCNDRVYGLIDNADWSIATQESTERANHTRNEVAENPYHCSDKPNN